MKLNELICNKMAKIVKIDLPDLKYKQRLEELGFFIGNEIKVLFFSIFKQTLLVTVFNNCFAIKTNIAKYIEVKLI